MYESNEQSKQNEIRDAELLIASREKESKDGNNRRRRDEIPADKQPTGDGRDADEGANEGEQHGGRGNHLEGERNAGLHFGDPD